MNVFIIIYFLLLKISVQWLSVSSYRVLLKPVKTSTKFSPFKEQFTSGLNTDDSPSNSIAFVPGPPYEESSETSETFPFKPLLQTGFQPTRDCDSFHLSSPTLPQILPSLRIKSQRENYTENLFTTGSNKLNFVSEENGGIHRKKSTFNSDSQKPRESPVLTPFKSEHQLSSNNMFSNADILQKLIKSPNYKVYAKPITNKQVHTWNEHESDGRKGLLSLKESKKSPISPVESLETLLKYNGNNHWIKTKKGTKTSHETNRNVPQSLFSTVTENNPPNTIYNSNYNKNGFVDLSKVRTMSGSGKQQQVNNENLANPHEYSAEAFLHLIENNNNFFFNNDSGWNNGQPVIKSFLERNQNRKLNSTKSEIFRPVEAGNIAAAESFVRSQATKVYSMTKPPQIKKSPKKKSREMRTYQKKKGFIGSEKPKFLLQQQQQQQLYNIPAIRYINSLTMAHFADPNSSSPRSELQEFMRALRQPFNLTQVLNYLRANKTSVNDYAASRMSGDFRGQKLREFVGQNHPIHLSSGTKSDSAAASTQQFSNSLNSAPETEPKVISLHRFGGKNGEENLAGEDEIPSIDSRIPKANKYDSINVWTQSNRKFQSFENVLFEASLIDGSNKVDIKRSTEEKENGHQKNVQTSKGRIRNRYRRETLLTNDKELPYGSDDVTGDKNEIRSDDEEVLEKISVEVETLKSQETKRPLTRLSGLDFLTRYYKTKSKPNQQVDDFWKVTTTNSNVSTSSTPITNVKAALVKPNESTKAIKDTLDEVNKQRPVNRNLPEKTTTRAPPRYSRKLRILVTAPPPLKNRNLQPKTKEVNQTRSILTNSSNVTKGAKTEIKPNPEKTIKKLFAPEVTTSKQSLPKLESSTKISLGAEKLFTTRPTKADEEKLSTKPFTIKVPKYISIVRDPVSRETAEEVSTTAAIRIESKTLPFTEAFETDKKFLREKPIENIQFIPKPQQSDFVVGNQETWKDKYLPEVSTLRSNFKELSLTPRPIPQIQSTKVVEGGNEETGTHKPKTIQYETITRNPATWRPEDVPEVSSPRYNFQEYITPPTVSIIPKETFLESKELREYKDYEVEGLRPKTLQYTTIDRNREPWKNEEPQQVSSPRPSYREFEPSIKIIEIGGGSKPATGRQPEMVPFSPLLTPFDSINQNGEPWKNEYTPEVSTLRSTIQIIVEPLKPKPVANGNSTDDKAKPNQVLGPPAPQETPEPSEAYDDGPVLYYIVNEKTGRGRWISYPSDKHKHKFKIPKNEGIPNRQKQKHKTKKIIKKP